MPSDDFPRIMALGAGHRREAGFRKRRRYDETFKRNAVRVLLESGKPVMTVAQAMGIDRTILQKWRKKYNDEFVTKPAVSLSNAVPLNEFLSLKREFESIKGTVEHLRIIVKKVLSCKYEESE
jgi:transposase